MGDLPEVTLLPVDPPQIRLCPSLYTTDMYVYPKELCSIPVEFEFSLITEGIVFNSTFGIYTDYFCASFFPGFKIRTVG